MEDENVGKIYDQLGEIENLKTQKADLTEINQQLQEENKTLHDSTVEQLSQIIRSQENEMETLQNNIEELKTEFGFMDSQVEQLKKERLNLMIDKNYEPLNASLLNTLFLNEKLYIASKDLLNVLEDIQISLRSINKLVDDASLKGYEASFKENNMIIENSIGRQKAILNKYIIDMQLMLSRKEGD